jgi:hypothetical protein
MRRRSASIGHSARPSCGFVDQSRDARRARSSAQPARAVREPSIRAIVCCVGHNADRMVRRTQPSLNITSTKLQLSPSSSCAATRNSDLLHLVRGARRVLRSAQGRALATTLLADRGAMLTFYADGGCGYAATRVSLPQGFKRARTGDRAGPRDRVVRPPSAFRMPCRASCQNDAWSASLDRRWPPWLPARRPTTRVVIN